MLNTAMTAPRQMAPREVRQDPDLWGRIVESAVGAHLIGSAAALECEVRYWRERNHEVDFVVQRGRHVTAIEVKSSRRRDTLPGLETFVSTFRPERTLLVGADGVGLEAFPSRPVSDWVG